MLPTPADEAITDEAKQTQPKEESPSDSSEAGEPDKGSPEHTDGGSSDSRKVDPLEIQVARLQERAKMLREAKRDAKAEAEKLRGMTMAANNETTPAVTPPNTAPASPATPAPVPAAVPATAAPAPDNSALLDAKFETMKREAEAAAKLAAEQRFAELVAEQKKQDALDAYRRDAAAKAGVTLVALVQGTTTEEIDASIVAAKEMESKIASKAKEEEAKRIRALLPQGVSLQGLDKGATQAQDLRALARSNPAEYERVRAERLGS